MARFYGGVSGKSKTRATRLGTEKTGLEVFANGWDFGVCVSLGVDQDGEDYADVFLNGGSNGGGRGKQLGRFTKKDLEK